jgi:hypothetical protein
MLERRAGVGRLCIDCKRRLIRYADLIRRTPRDAVLVVTCDGCGFPQHIILDGHTEREKGLIREMHGPRGRTLEARRRRFAIQVYLMMTPRQRAIEAAGDAEEKRLRGIAPAPAAVRSQLKVLDEYAAVAADRQAARRMLISEDEEETRVTRRAVFREVMSVVDEARAQAQKAGDDELYRLLVMTKLEEFIFGETLPETLDRIEAHERGVRVAKEAREREAREREERYERERREREERWRLEAEERERARQERAGEVVPRAVTTPVGTLGDEPADRLRRLGVSNYTPPAAGLRFRTDPTAPVRRSPMVIDPTAAHVPAPARMVVPDPADPSRQMIVMGDVGPATYDPNDPDAVQFMRSSPEKLPDHQKYYRGEYYDGDPRY